MRFYLALWLALLAMWASRILGRGSGSALPGKLALAIDPAILKRLARGVKRVIVVTGTNGKTTTNNMLVSILRAGGYTVVANLAGANLITGVTTAFLAAAGWRGCLQADYASLEVDEASLPGVLEFLSPRLVVVTNFFRDQLDRYGELDKTVAIVAEALQKQKQEIHLILNADDPLVAQLSIRTGRPAMFYGLTNVAVNSCSYSGADSREGRFCPFCGQVLSYSYYNYSQLGSYSCLQCGFSRPEPDVEGVQVCRARGCLSCQVTVKQGRSVMLSLPLEGIYNIYNALAACSAGLYLGLPVQVMANALAHYQTATGRLERFTYHDKQVLLNLVKNPAGFNAALQLIANVEPVPLDILIAINDNAADGRDISWLWDVDFEMLSQFAGKTGKFVCTGQRGAEMALRLKYAGMAAEQIVYIPDYEQAVKTVLQAQGRGVYMLATYTALWPVERIVNSYARRERAGSARLSPVS
ncbi:MAG: MurT ligase domain-containing protein [Bacillota bacterium]